MPKNTVVFEWERDLADDEPDGFIDWFGWMKREPSLYKFLTGKYFRCVERIRLWRMANDYKLAILEFIDPLSWEKITVVAESSSFVMCAVKLDEYCKNLLGMLDQTTG